MDHETMNSNAASVVLLAPAPRNHEVALLPLSRRERQSERRSETSSSAAAASAPAARHDFPVAPSVVQEIPRVRGQVNHSYRDFSRVPSTADYRAPTSLAAMSFAEKLHHVLRQGEYSKWICWMPHGRAFRVLEPTDLEAHVLPRYFGLDRYMNFMRELQNHGFKHITRGADRNCFYHECMLKGRVHLCRYMPRRRITRRLTTDVDNEPNFYRISSQYPLEEDRSAATCHSKKFVESSPKQQERQDDLTVSLLEILKHQNRDAAQVATLSRIVREISRNTTTCA